MSHRNDVDFLPKNACYLKTPLEKDDVLEHAVQTRQMMGALARLFGVCCLVQRFVESDLKCGRTVDSH